MSDYHENALGSFNRFQFTDREIEWLDFLAASVLHGAAATACPVGHLLDDPYVQVAAVTMARALARVQHPVPVGHFPSNGRGSPHVFAHPSDARNWSA